MTAARLSFAVLLGLAAAPTILAARSAPGHATMPYAEERRTILALRANDNRALAAHDLEATMAIVAENYVITDGDSSIDRSAADDRRSWREEFARPGHDRYVRTPGLVEVGERKGVLRAAESGTWLGIDHKAAGESRPFGRYFVHWSKASGRWLVVSEIYVTLGCNGPGCAS